MKKILFTIGISAFLAACIGSKDETLPSNWQREVIIVPPENVITQPDKEREALQSFKEQKVNKADVAAYTDRLAKRLRKELRSTGVQVKETSGRIDLIVPNKVAFGGNQGRIQNKFESALSSVAGVLKKYDQTMIQVIGYTDNVGSVLENERLSKQRAETIASFLRDNDIATERIFANGLGSQNPVTTNATVAGREQNNRIEITLISLQ